MIEYYSNCILESENSFRWSEHISAIALIVAIWAVFISIRYAVISLLNSVLLERANECNKFIEEDNNFPKHLSNISGILTGIVTAE